MDTSPIEYNREYLCCYLPYQRGSTAQERVEEGDHERTTFLV